MKIDLNKVQATTLFSGFSNYTAPVIGSASIAAQNLAANRYLTAFIVIPMNNNNAVSQVQVQWVGLDAFTRLVPGNIAINYPNNASPSYQVETFYYFTGGNLHIDTYVPNQTGGTVAIPAITINATADLYLAPF